MGSLYDLLPAKDRDMIADYILRYGPESGLNRDPAPLRHRLRFWDETKSEYLYRLMGGELILEQKVQYEASTDELVDRYRHYADHYCGKFYSALYNIIYEIPEFKQLFYERWSFNVNGHSGFYSYITSIDTLMINRWEGPETLIPLPQGKNFKVAPGTKITRILGRLAKEWNLPNWENVREAQAKAMTTRLTKGTLCLSIHPMDYITMSDNAENWDSCMNWQDNGGYRAGTIEMMNSKSVVVAYIKHPEHEFEGWNSKTWRELYIVTPELISNIKGYPYRNDWLSKYVVTWIKNLAETSGVGLYEPSMKIFAEDEANDDPWFKRNHVSVDFRTNTMYNDCGRNDQFVYVGYNLNNTRIYINYSGVLNCMICGEPESAWVDFEDSNNVVCSGCEEYQGYYCDECGDRISEDEVYFSDDGTPYCYNCFNELFVSPIDAVSDSCLRDDCSTIILRLPDGSCTPVHDKAYVLNMDHFINSELYVGPAESKEYFEYSNCDNVYIIPYSEVNEEVKYECVHNSYDIVRWDNYGKSKEEINNLYEQKYGYKYPW